MPLDRAVSSRYLPVSHEAVPAVSFVDRAPMSSVLAFDRQPSAPFTSNLRVEFGSRQTGINSLLD